MTDKINDILNCITNKFNHKKVDIIFKDINRLKVCLYTFNNRFVINAITDNQGEYLGCQASSRKSRAGEDWYRGRDLFDSKEISEENLNKILLDILNYELEDVFTHNKKRVCLPISDENHSEHLRPVAVEADL